MRANVMCSLAVWGALVASPRIARRVRVNATYEPSPLDGKKSRCLPLPIATPQGYMWNSVRKLRPAMEEEATCEPTKDACSLAYIAMKYDEKCVGCEGSGFVKTRAFKSSRRNSKSTTGRCLLCAGVGYVRVNTTRIEPDFSKNDSMPADYDPRNVGFPKGEQGPWCEVKEKSWKKNAGKKIGKAKIGDTPATKKGDNINIGTATGLGPR